MDVYFNSVTQGHENLWRFYSAQDCECVVLASPYFSEISSILSLLMTCVGHISMCLLDFHLSFLVLFLGKCWPVFFFNLGFVSFIFFSVN